MPPHEYRLVEQGAEAMGGVAQEVALRAAGLWARRAMAARVRGQRWKEGVGVMARRHDTS